jgi:hypothetical protein
MTWYDCDISYRYQEQDALAKRAGWRSEKEGSRSDPIAQGQPSGSFHFDCLCGFFILFIFLTVLILKLILTVRNFILFRLIYFSNLLIGFFLSFSKIHRFVGEFVARRDGSRKMMRQFISTRSWKMLSLARYTSFGRQAITLAQTIEIAGSISLWKRFGE